MTDPTRQPDPKPHTTPRWVKVFGIIAVVVVLLFAVLHVTRRPHSPGGHLPGGSGDHAPPSGGTERDAR